MTFTQRAAQREPFGLVGVAEVEERVRKFDLLAAAVIATTGFTRADPLASLTISLLIIPRTVEPLREAVDVLLEATPEGIDLNDVRQHILDTPGVTGCHDCTRGRSPAAYPSCPHTSSSTTGSGPTGRRRRSWTGCRTACKATSI